MDNVIQIPEEFLDYEKLEVWKKLKIRITDEDVRRDINEIWTRWTRLLLDRENRNSVEIVNPFSPSYTPSVPYDPDTPVTTGGNFDCSLSFNVDYYSLYRLSREFSINVHDRQSGPIYLFLQST